MCHTSEKEGHPEVQDATGRDRGDYRSIPGLESSKRQAMCSTTPRRVKLSGCYLFVLYGQSKKLAWSCKIEWLSRLNSSPSPLPWKPSLPSSALFYFKTGKAWCVLTGVKRVIFTWTSITIFGATDVSKLLRIMTLNNTGSFYDFFSG